MNKKVYIIGAGGFGREVHSWLSDWCRVNNGWEISGFIDDNLASLDKFTGLPPICSTISEYQPDTGTFHVCALGNPGIKKKVVETLVPRGIQFMTLQHPSAVVGQRVRLGKGVVICPYAVLTTDITIGDFVTINASSTVGHDVQIGNYCTLSGHCDVTGNAVLEDSVFMGSHAAVLPNTHVCSNSVIGAGSVVLRRVPPHSTVFGVPAKRITA